MRKLFIYLCFSQIAQILCQNKTAIQSTFELLEQGQNQTKLTNETDLVLVFGATGSGKSTFIQWIAGDNTKLISKETITDSDEYLIEDMDDRIGSSKFSKTLFPELVVDELTGTTFYDFPGFSDTRSASHDIVASFFMKSVMDHVKNVKMLFLTSYSTVREGMDRVGFPGLLQNIDDMIGDIEKFKNSIALVVSKVDNIYIKNGKMLMPDSTVVKGIAGYLLKITTDFETDLRNPDISDKKRKLSEKAIKIINILLTQEGGKYTRIILFRRPNEAGPLSEIELLVEGKVIVHQMVSKNLQFTHTDPNDFGFTISDTSKLEIHKVENEINDQITAIIERIVSDIQYRLKSFVAPVREKIDVSNLEALSLDEAIEFSIITSSAQVILFDVVTYFTHLRAIGGMGEKLTTYLFKLGVEVPGSMKENMSKFSKYFEFLQHFSEKPLLVQSLSWTTSFKSALTYLTESDQSIKDKARSLATGINSQISSDVELFADFIERNFMDDVNHMTKTIRSFTADSKTEKVNASEAKTFHQKLVIGKEKMIKLVENLKVIPTPESLFHEISEALSSMDVELPNDVLTDIFKNSQKFSILEKVSCTHFNFPSAQWSNSFKTVVAYIQMQNIFILAEQSAVKIALKVGTLLDTLTEKVKSIVGKKPLELEVIDVGVELKRWQSIFGSIRDGFTPKSTLKKLIDDITSSLSQLKVNEQSINDNLETLKEQEKYLGFLRALDGKSIDIDATPLWKAFVNDLVKSFDVELNFNVFALALYDTLSQFKVQSDVSRYDVQALSDWGKPLRPQGIHVDRNNFKIFMTKVKELNIKESDKISNIVPSETQIIILNNILEMTLKNRVDTQCPTAPGSTIVLKANFIKFSDFVDNNGKFKGCGWTHISALEIYALNALFIDRDLNALGGRLKLSIVASKGEVIGTRKITLDGENAENLPEKAANGLSPGDHGQNGSNGFPGGSAGAFLGVFSSFIRSEKLTISANGGNGSHGQSGGDGVDGKDGKTPPDVTTRSKSCDFKSYKDHGFTRIEYSGKGCCKRDYGSLCSCYRIFGIEGTNGGNAGSPGVGGLAGLSGRISVISLLEGSKVTATAIDGKTGVNGVPGAIGKGGLQGKNKIVSCSAFMPIRGAPPSWSMRDHNLEEQRSTSNGQHSSNSWNSNTFTNVIPAATIRNAGLYLRIFIGFFIENSNERFVRLSTRQIYDQINSNPETRDFQDTLGLIEDLKLLKSFTQERILNLLSFYESYLAQIEKYAANPKPTEKTDEFRKVLSYLYTASLAQMSNLKKNPDSDLIIDIGGYLDLVSQNVKSLSTLQDESRLVRVVESVKSSFKKELDMKIDEAQRLIKNTLTPEMSNIGSQFDDKVSKLVNETIALQKAAHKQKDMLESKKRELENTMTLNTVLNVFKVAGHVSSFFGPVGKAVSDFTEIGTSVAGGFLQGSSFNFPSKNRSMVEKFQATGNALLGFSTSIMRDHNNIAEVTRAIKDLEETIKKLENFEKRIYEKLIPMLDKMGKDLIETAKNLNSKSSVFLDVTSWQVQKTLKETGLEIQKFTRGYEIEESVSKLVENLQEVLKVLVKVYDRIQDYQEQQKLAVYMAHLSSASVKQIVVSSPLVSNSFRDLQISIQSNIILNQYGSVLNAFKQWIFPFAEIFLKDFELPKQLVTSSTDIQVLASNAVSRIEGIKSRIKKYKTTIEEFDEHIYVAQFNRSSSIMKPFYVWKNEDYGDIITKLLAGEAVLVKADIANSDTEKDAIKFNFIGFALKSNDPSMQAEVDRTLLNCTVSMTHLGTSHYRYNGQYVSIESSSQSMMYSVEKGTIQNNVYKKLLAGDIILSPYAMWELRLSSTSFGSLSEFRDRVDLVLEGSGSFVKAGKTNFDVATYYKVDDSIRFSSV